jgi:hypothetical protein
MGNICKHWKFHGADSDGDYQTCDLEESPILMVSCNGDIKNCRHLEQFTLKCADNEEMFRLYTITETD